MLASQQSVTHIARVTRKETHFGSFFCVFAIVLIVVNKKEPVVSWLSRVLNKKWLGEPKYDPHIFWWA
jgi:hypothetical protein